MRTKKTRRMQVMQSDWLYSTIFPMSISPGHTPTLKEEDNRERIFANFEGTSTADEAVMQLLSMDTTYWRPVLHKRITSKLVELSYAFARADALACCMIVDDSMTILCKVKIIFDGLQEYSQLCEQMMPFGNFDKTKPTASALGYHEDDMRSQGPQQDLHEQSDRNHHQTPAEDRQGETEQVLMDPIDVPEDHDQDRDSVPERITDVDNEPEASFYSDQINGQCNDFQGQQYYGYAPPLGSYGVPAGGVLFTPYIMEYERRISFLEGYNHGITCEFFNMSQYSSAFQERSDAVQVTMQHQEDHIASLTKDAQDLKASIVGWECRFDALQAQSTLTDTGENRVTDAEYMVDQITTLQSENMCLREALCDATLRLEARVQYSVEIDSVPILQGRCDSTDGEVLQCAYTTAAVCGEIESVIDGLEKSLANIAEVSERSGILSKNRLRDMASAVTELQRMLKVSGKNYAQSEKNMNKQLRVHIQELASVKVVLNKSNDVVSGHEKARIEIEERHKKQTDSFKSAIQLAKKRMSEFRSKLDDNEMTIEALVEELQESYRGATESEAKILVESDFRERSTVNFWKSYCDILKMQLNKERLVIKELSQSVHKMKTIPPSPTNIIYLSFTPTPMCALYHLMPSMNTSNLTISPTRTIKSHRAIEPLDAMTTYTVTTPTTSAALENPTCPYCNDIMLILPGLEACCAICMKDFDFVDNAWIEVVTDIGFAEGDEVAEPVVAY